MKKRNNAFLLFALASSLWAASCGNDNSSTGDGDGDGDADGSGGNGGAAMTSGGSDTGGGSGASTPTGALSLVFQTPESGAENVAAHEPIVLGFSADVNESTVGDALRVRADGEDVGFSYTVDGRNISITLDEVPDLPARVSVTISGGLSGTDGGEFAGDSWNFTYPLWQRPERVEETTDNGVAFGALADGSPVVVTGTNAELTASVFRAGEWEDAVALPSTSGAGLDAVGAATSASGLLVAWIERQGADESVAVARFDGEEFSEADGPELTASSIEARLGVTASGDPVLVTQVSAGQLQLHELTNGNWSTAGTPLSVSGLRAFDVAVSDAGPVVAAVNGDSDIEVHRWTGADWEQVGADIDRVLTRDDPGIDVGAHGSSIYVAYQDGDSAHDPTDDLDDPELISHHMLVAEFDGSWSPAGSALDLEMDNEASFPSLVVDEDGVPLVAWLENLGGTRAVIAARRQGDAWDILGERALDRVGSSISAISVSADPDGNIHLATTMDDGVDIARFNSSPSLPTPEFDLSDRGSCEFPEDTDLRFPTTLADTGCYANIAAHEVVGAAVPYNINSILWTDGAYKKRYILLPEGETMTYSSHTDFGMPVGTIIIKEFYIDTIVGDPASRTPMETRFLVKRCEEGAAGCGEPWQGYTYQWNTAGNAGTLLADAPAGIVVDWTVQGASGPETHEHEYPSRAECITCHNAGGRLLGVMGAQINRPQEYGGIIANQIRALSDAGLFGSSAPEAAAEELDRLPSPQDVSHSLEQRSLAYFQSNCSHCHRPGGDLAAQSIDFRYYGTGLQADNICDKLTPGDPEVTFQIFTRDAARLNADQMPPLATRIPDTQQLPVTHAWITNMGTCP